MLNWRLKTRCRSLGPIGRLSRRRVWNNKVSSSPEDEGLQPSKRCEGLVAPLLLSRFGRCAAGWWETFDVVLQRTHQLRWPSKALPRAGRSPRSSQIHSKPIQPQGTSTVKHQATTCLGDWVLLEVTRPTAQKPSPHERVECTVWGTFSTDVMWMSHGALLNASGMDTGLFRSRLREELESVCHESESEFHGEDDAIDHFDDAVHLRGVAHQVLGHPVGGQSNLKSTGGNQKDRQQFEVAASH